MQIATTGCLIASSIVGDDSKLSRQVQVGLAGQLQPEATARKSVGRIPGYVVDQAVCAAVLAYYVQVIGAGRDRGGVAGRSGEHVIDECVCGAELAGVV